MLVRVSEERLKQSSFKEYNRVKSIGFSLKHFHLNLSVISLIQKSHDGTSVQVKSTIKSVISLMQKAQWYKIRFIYNNHLKASFKRFSSA